MLTFVAPLIVYLLWFPVMLVTAFRVEIGILFFITFVPIIALMKKIVDFPQGHNFPDFLLISIICGWILGALKNGRPIFKRSPVNMVVILMIIGSIISLIRGYTFIDLPEELNLLRMMTWKNYMILPVIYFVAINNIETEKLAKWIIICVLLTMVASNFSFYSTFRWLRTYHYRDSIRISGPFSFLGPNEMGIFFTVYTFLLLGIFYYIEDKRLKYLILLICAFNFYPIVFSYSRAAYTSALTGFLTLGLLKDRKFLVLLVVLIIFYSLILPRSVVERINMTVLDEAKISREQEERSGVDVGGVEIDTVGRKELWGKAKLYFENEPLLGIGFDTFRHLEGRITHSMFLKILAEQGLVGMTVFVSFITTLLWQAHRLFRRSTNNLGKGIGLGFFTCTIVHLVGSVSGDQSLYYNLMAIYWLFMGIMASFTINHVTKDVRAGFNK